MGRGTVRGRGIRFAASPGEDLVAELLTEVERWSSVDRMVLLTLLHEAAATDPALREALRQVARGGGPLRRRAWAAFALGTGLDAHLSRDRALMTVLEQVVVEMFVAQLLHAGPDRATRQDFLSQDLDLQIRTLDLLMYGSSLPVDQNPRIAAFLVWLAGQERNSVLGREASHALRDLDRDADWWRDQFVSAVHETDYESAARALELVFTWAQGGHAMDRLRRGLAFLAAEDLEEAQEDLMTFARQAPEHALAHPAAAAARQVRQELGAGGTEAPWLAGGVPLLTHEPVTRHFLSRAGSRVGHRRLMTWGLALLLDPDLGRQAAPDPMLWVEAVSRVTARARQRVRSAPPDRQIPPELRGPVEVLWTVLGLEYDPHWLADAWEATEQERLEGADARAEVAASALREPAMELPNRRDPLLREFQAAEGKDFPPFFARHLFSHFLPDHCPGTDPAQLSPEQLREFPEVYLCETPPDPSELEDGDRLADQIAAFTVACGRFLDRRYGTALAPFLEARQPEMERAAARLLAIWRTGNLEVRPEEETLPGPDGCFRVVRTEPGRIWLKHEEGGPALTLVTFHGLEQHLRPGDQIQAELGRLPTGRHALRAFAGPAKPASPEPKGRVPHPPADGRP